MIPKIEGAQFVTPHHQSYDFCGSTVQCDHVFIFVVQTLGKTM